MKLFRLKRILLIFVSVFTTAGFFLGCQKSIPPEPEKATISTPKKIENENPPMQKSGDAVFLTVHGDVSHKRGGEVVWASSSLETPLYLRDWVQTKEHSSCQISLLEKRRLSMSANSVLVLLDREDSPERKRAVVGVSQGEIRGEVDSDADVDSELLLKLPMAWFRIKASVQEGVKKIFRMSLTDQTLKVHMEQGKADLEWKGKKISLDEGQSYREVLEKPIDESPDFETLPLPTQKKLQPEKPKKATKSNPQKRIVSRFAVFSPKSGAVIQGVSVK